MTIDQLRTFCRVAHRLNFTVVAAEMNFTQSAISQQIQALEQALKAKLFERVGRRLELAPAGEQLLAIVEPFLQELDDTIAVLGEKRRGIQGRLLLGGSIAVGTYVLPRLVSRFRNNHPRVEISLFIQPTDETLRLLWERRLHLALVEAPISQRWQSKLQIQPLGEDRIVLIAAPSFPLPAEPLGRRDIMKLPLLLRSPGSATRQTLLERLEAYGIHHEDLNVQFELGHTEALKRMTAAAIGVAFVPLLAVEDELREGKLRIVPVDPDLDLHRHLFLVRHGHQSKVARSFERMLLEARS